MNPLPSRQSFFEKIYQSAEDPWNFASSDYERDRYARILEALAGRRYKSVFEPACSVGVLTSHLGHLSDRVVAFDISPTTVARAHERCRNLTNVSISCGELPRDVPRSSFDLIVFSEVGYYFDEIALHELGVKLVERMEPNGTLLAAHWLGSSEDHILSGDRVHEILGGLKGLRHDLAHRYSGFRLDRWIRS